ncbi:MAG: uroporphyrinogen-III synthase, partial [Zavarzinia sp.]|nr:uroporphyrinogen-III synthase [Zavarzinia sp.]
GVMRLLVTRIAAEAARLTGELAAAGHVCGIAPMIEIVPRTGITLDLSGVQALLVTSGSGVAALAGATPERGLPVLAVGDSTARKARAAGFRDVRNADGDVEALTDLARRTLDPGAGRLIHAAGASLAGDLAGRLTALGFDVERVTLYDSQPARALPDEIRESLMAGDFEGILFFSPRTAATFVTLTRNGLPKPDFSGRTAYCLSAAVADALAPLGFGRVLVAAHPTEADLRALLAPSPDLRSTT